MSTVTIRDGVATITTPTRKTEVHLSATAETIFCERSDSASDAEILALSAGYLDLEKRVGQLEAELEAARSGTIGREHAEAMQGARKVIAEQFKATMDFLEVYDQGDAPDGVALRDSTGAADMWLLRDVNACLKRAKVLEGGAS